MATELFVQNLLAFLHLMRYSVKALNAKTLYDLFCTIIFQIKCNGQIGRIFIKLIDYEDHWYDLLESDNPYAIVVRTHLRYGGPHLRVSSPSGRGLGPLKAS
jgi:hypothetical protein